MSTQLNSSIEELRSSFFLLQSKIEVAKLLDTPPKLLNYYLFVRPPVNRYTKFEIPKKTGGVREISAPKDSLKLIQNKLLQVLTAVYKPKGTVHGFVNRKGIVTNAKQHTGKNFVLNIDIKDFFPTINFGRVRGLFRAKPYNLPDNVATVLAQICCHENQLPQGAPTSPIISNMICSKMDSELSKLAKLTGCTYSRYADDITLSTNKPYFPSRIAQVKNEGDNVIIELSQAFTDILTNNGFIVNSKKVRLQTSNFRQEVTGLTVNESVNVSRRYVRQVRAMLHALEKFGEDCAKKEFSAKYDKKFRSKGDSKLLFANVLRSKIEFVGLVKGKNNSTYVNFRNRLSKINPELISEIEYEVPVYKTKTSKEYDVVVFTEGKTDWMILKTALQYLKTEGKYCNLNISFNEFDGDRGDSVLYKMCEHYAQKKQDSITIFLFDRDKPDIISKVSEDDKCNKAWGNNVYSAVIPIPDHRKHMPNISIEFYFSDNDIKTYDKSNRRLFISNEFNNKSGRHVDGMLNCTDDKFRKALISIIDSNVFDSDNDNVALTKADFAVNIQNKIDDFANVSFEFFPKIFDELSDIISSYEVALGSDLEI